MAVQRFKIALNNARFPLVSTQAQRAVFIPGLDSAPRTPRQFMGEDENIDFNTAQVIYSENVMPVAEGLRSVGYRRLIAPTAVQNFDSIFALRDANEATVLFSPAAGTNYIYDADAGMWDSNPYENIFPGLTVDSAYTPLAEANITYAYVDGKTFICYSRIKSTTGVDMSLIAWDTATQSLIPVGSLVSNLPFAAGKIDGIAGTAGFLVVWSELAIAWAPFNGTAFDFTIYANGNFTGAGVQTPEDVKGNIRSIISLPGGFIAFTDKNAIAATYHAQSLIAPWIFREIPAAGGLESYEQATVEGSLGRIFAYTTAGLQSISLNSSENVWPDVSDFITGRQIERYSAEQNKLIRSSVNLDMFTKVTNVGNRYVVISYGTLPGVYGFALVHDLTLKRWGKLRLQHADCFYYAYGATADALTYASLYDMPYDDAFFTTYEETTTFSNAFVAAQHGLAFLTRKGEVVLANWSQQARETVDNALVILGRVQLTRTSNVQLNRLEVEGHYQGDAYIQPSYDGKTLADRQQLTEVLSAPDMKVFGGMIDAKNFNILVTGTFALSTIIVEATPTGKF